MIKKIRIGITGQNGFIGYHLMQTLIHIHTEFEVIEFKRNFFESPFSLDAFVSKCDVIVHLAALNRHNSPEIIYETNLKLANLLKDSLIRTDSKAHVIITSSTQESNQTLYGKSKKDCRLVFSEWSNLSGTNFSGLIIPNVYGPFGIPFYNSVVSTFCHQLTNDEIPSIENDNRLNLIYVGELVNIIIELILTKDNSHEFIVNHSAEAFVSELLNFLKSYKEIYQIKGQIPFLNSDFELKLFNTYRCYMNINKYFPKYFDLNVDTRGQFVEIARHGISGQTSFSTTFSGITRGNHFHTRKIERFAVIKGKALIQLRRVGTKEIYEFELDGTRPSYVDMPIWFTHNIRNIGTEPLYTVFWINEPYDISNSDTYNETV
jgi:UDP-2-acetamido-2,6-beta-L-arabino-hexul-4-ose reductase